MRLLIIDQCVLPCVSIIKKKKKFSELKDGDIEMVTKVQRQDSIEFSIHSRTEQAAEKK